MEVWTDLCDRKCSYSAVNDIMRVWTNLCYREFFSVTNCWQELHFEFFPPKLQQECAEPLCVVTGDDSSHSQGQSGKRLLLASGGHPVGTLLYHGSCIDPTHQSHNLDLKCAFVLGSRSERGGARRVPTQRAIINLSCWDLFLRSQQRSLTLSIL